MSILAITAHSLTRSSSSQCKYLTEGIGCVSFLHKLLIKVLNSLCDLLMLLTITPDNYTRPVDLMCTAKQDIFCT